MLLVVPEKKLDREQQAKLQELASGLGAVIAKQLQAFELESQESNEEDDDENDSPLSELEAGEQIVDDPHVIGYLEDCFRLQ